MGDSDERQPLVQSNQSNNQGNVSSRTVVLEGPPVEPETPTPRTGTLEATVPCQVCRAVIVLDSKSSHHVAKCTECGEATPIKGAPPGKKYVRCPCRCLLICKSASARIACPRPNCKLTINLAYTDSRLPNSNIQQGPQTPAPAPAVFPGYGGINTGPGNSAGHVDLVCGACGSPFVINGVSAMDMRFCMVQCVVCHAPNSIGSTYAMRRTAILFFCAFLFIGCAIGITFGTYGPLLNYDGVPIVWIAAYVMGVGLIGRGIMYLTMPVAVIINYRHHEDSWVLGRMETDKDKETSNATVEKI